MIINPFSNTCTPYPVRPRYGLQKFESDFQTQRERTVIFYLKLNPLQRNCIAGESMI